MWGVALWLRHLNVVFCFVAAALWPACSSSEAAGNASLRDPGDPLSAVSRWFYGEELTAISMQGEELTDISMQ